MRKPSWPDPVSSRPDLNPLLTILHTNDFHNHLSPEQVERLRVQRAAIEGRGILLDAGDAGSSGNITFRPGGEPILEEMGKAGYDAMTVGNRDFHFSRAGFHAKLSRAPFPILCANVRAAGTRRALLQSAVGRAESEDAPPVSAAILCETADLRIAVFGVTVPMITDRMAVRRVSSYVFDDPIVTAAAIVPWLRRTLHPDLVVALTHIGIKRDRELAESVPEIDLIIGGHSHVALDTGERVGETLLVQAGSFGHLLGRVTVERGPNGKFEMRASLGPL